MRHNLLILVGWLQLTACCLPLTLVGCSGPEKATVVPVTGKVLLDGEPLKFGSVTLQPTRGQPARGEIGPNGEFTLSTYRPGDGAPLGRHKVKVTCYLSQDPTAKSTAGSGTVESLGESLIPEHYTRFDSSGLEIAIIAAGSKPYVIELENEAPVDATPLQSGKENAAGAAPPGADRTKPPASERSESSAQSSTTDDTET